MLRCGAGIHERLRNNRQARIYRGRLVDVEYKVGILDEIDPETERQATEREKKSIRQIPFE